MPGKRLEETRICERCGNPFHPWNAGGDYSGRYCQNACSKASVTERFWNNVDKTPGHGPWGDCWIWIASLDKDGYGMFKPCRAHRFSWELHNGPIPTGLHILHRCDNPPCVRPDHLFAGTNDDNMKDMVSKGRSLHGADHHNAKLSDEDVRSIRKKYAEGKTYQKELASEYGVNQTLISAIVCNRIWKHLI